MRVVVTGGTGFVGSALVAALLGQGHQVTVLSRNETPRLPHGAVSCRWGREEEGWQACLEGADAIVNLAGAGLADQRWTPERKRLILDSRAQATRALVEACAHAHRPPKVLISGSAVGYYGPRGYQPLTEADDAGRGFLSEVCQRWEAEAQRAEALGLRVVRLRAGMVLGKEGGALPRLALPFRWFVGGPLGSGRQWVSWIERGDLIRLIQWVLEQDGLAGPLNAVAPEPVTNAEFSRNLGKALRRPSLLPVPAFVLRWAVGEMAEEMLLSGQRVVPQRALAGGFTFRFPDSKSALCAVLA